MESLLFDKMSFPRLGGVESMILMAHSFDLLPNTFNGANILSVAKKVNNEAGLKIAEDENFLNEVCLFFKKEAATSLVRSMEKVQGYQEHPEYLLVLLIGLKLRIIEAFEKKTDNSLLEINQETIYDEIERSMKPDYKNRYESVMNTNQKLVYDCLDEKGKCKHFVDATTEQYLSMFVKRVLIKSLEELAESGDLVSMLKLSSLLNGGKIKI